MISHILYMLRCIHNVSIVLYVAILYFQNRFTRIVMWYKLLLSVAAIYFAYITMSIITEGMYKTEYISINPNLPPAQFRFPSVVIWLGSLLCAISGYVISLFLKEKPNPIPFRQKLILSTLYSTNILTTNYCLLYISYPVQVIGRNIRFLFVVLIGSFFSRLRNTAHAHLKLGKHKIFMAIVITIGVLLYNFAKYKNKDKAENHDPNLEWFGYLLLFISVVCDAFFSDSQAFNKGQYKPTANQLFTTTNFYAFIIIFIFSIFVDKSVIPFFQFVQNYPSAIKDILVVGVLQVIGQISIYYVVANFKQHVFPLISTTRKIITVLASIFYFGHNINNLQWVAIAIVFLGMFYELYEELSHQKHKEQVKEQHKDNIQKVQQQSSSQSDSQKPKKQIKTT